MFFSTLGDSHRRWTFVALCAFTNYNERLSFDELQIFKDRKIRDGGRNPEGPVVEEGILTPYRKES